MTSVLTTFNMQILSPEPEQDAPSWNDTEKRVLADLPAMLEAVEEELTKLLPEGYTAQIAEWDKEAV